MVSVMERQEGFRSLEVCRILRRMATLELEPLPSSLSKEMVGVSTYVER
jgi:hypothetical protein